MLLLHTFILSFPLFLLLLLLPWQLLLLLSFLGMFPRFLFVFVWSCCSPSVQLFYVIFFLLWRLYVSPLTSYSCGLPFLIINPILPKLIMMMMIITRRCLREKCKLGKNVIKRKNANWVRMSSKERTLDRREREFNKKTHSLYSLLSALSFCFFSQLIFILFLCFFSLFSSSSCGSLLSTLCSVLFLLSTYFYFLLQCLFCLFSSSCWSCSCSSCCWHGCLYFSCRF